MKRLFFILIFFVSSFALAADNEISVFKFEEGASISFSKEWTIDKGKEFEFDAKNKLKKELDNPNFKTILPKDQIIDKVKLLMLASLNKDLKSASVLLTTSPKEMSQTELEHLTQAVQNKLTEMMMEKIKPALEIQNRTFMEQCPSVIEKINGVFCFKLMFKFKDAKNMLKISELRYFYLDRGTFFLTSTYNQEFIEKNKDLLDNAIKSFSIQ